MRNAIGAIAKDTERADLATTYLTYDALFAAILDMGSMTFQHSPANPISFTTLGTVFEVGVSGTDTWTITLNQGSWTPNAYNGGGVQTSDVKPYGVLANNPVVSNNPFGAASVTLARVTTGVDTNKKATATVTYIFTDLTPKSVGDITIDMEDADNAFDNDGNALPKPAKVDLLRQIDHNVTYTPQAPVAYKDHNPSTGTDVGGLTKVTSTSHPIQSIQSGQNSTTHMTHSTTQVIIAGHVHSLINSQRLLFTKSPATVSFWNPFTNNWYPYDTGVYETSTTSVDLPIGGTVQPANLTYYTWNLKSTVTVRGDTDLKFTFD